MKLNLIQRLTLLTVLLIGTTSTSFAVTPTSSISLQVVKISQTAPDPEDPDPNDVGTRAPGRPFQCTFDTERGIEFIGQETPEFALFEIYVTDTECIYASGDEFDFIDQLFTLSGVYQICLTTTEGIVYAGYIDL